MLEDDAVDLASAALRHVRDAEWLAAPTNPQRSLDQSWHLVGYGPECARKAILGIRIFDKSLGHRLDQASEDVLGMAVALDPFALRYDPGDWPRRFPALIRWQEVVRYDRTGTVVQQGIELDRALAQAREAVDGVVFSLWADGRFPDRALPW